MAELSSSRTERRRAMRAPVREVAVLHASGGPLHGALENLSRGGALVSVASEPPPDEHHEIELRLAQGGGWIRARTIRVEQVAKRWRIAVAFEPVDAATQDAIDASIAAAQAAARTRPVLVIDDRAERRAQLIARLAERGLTPLAPRTPLEAIDLLTRAQLHLSVCLIAPGFGVPSTDLASILSDSFPWVSTVDISDDLDETTARAVDAWSTTPLARFIGATVEPSREPAPASDPTPLAAHG